MQNIVEFIKEEMSKRGMTYDLLAERMGTTRQNLWTKLNKNTRPNFETVRKILAALCSGSWRKRNCRVLCEHR